MSRQRKHFTPEEIESWPEGYKGCTKCREVKPVSMFGAHPLGLMGLFPRCRPCHNRSVKIYKENKALNEAQSS